MRSDAMLAGLVEAGGRYKVVQRDSDAAKIEITIAGQTQAFALTWQEAQEEPFTKGKGGKIKDNWATPRSRMQMLWARVVSDGVRVMAPQVVCGGYTPEEISDFDELPAGGNGAPKQIESKPATTHRKPAEQQPGQQDPAGDVVDAEFTVTDSTYNPTEADSNSATAEQCEAIRDLFASLDIPHDKQEAILQKRNANALRNLSSQQAGELIANLQALQAKRQQEASELAKASKPTTPPEMSQSINEPCGDELVKQIKDLMLEVSQRPGNHDLVGRVKAKLADHGIERLADLTLVEARTLLDALQARNLETFFEASLTGYKPEKN